MPICKGKDRLDAFKGCGKEVQKYGNSTYKLCIRCNSKRLLDKKTPKKATGQRELFDEIWAELRQDIETAIQFADDSPYPTPDQIMVDVYTKSSTSSTSSTTVGTKS